MRCGKQQGKVRFVGFTGHKNPSIHLDMLNRGFKFDTVLGNTGCAHRVVLSGSLNAPPVGLSCSASPVAFDPGWRSFEEQVLPVAVEKGMAVFGMKSMGGSGEPIVHGILTPTEALR